MPSPSIASFTNSRTPLSLLVLENLTVSKVLFSVFCLSKLFKKLFNSALTTLFISLEFSIISLLIASSTIPSVISLANPFCLANKVVYPPSIKNLVNLALLVSILYIP